VRLQIKKLVPIDDYADALETFIDLENDDIYTLTAIYKDFTGKFSAKVSIRRF
jgi:hypothetical protein